MTFEEFINAIDGKVHEPMVTARFGDQWKDHQKRLYDEAEIDFETILNIAWVQGRRAQLLENELRRVYDINIRGKQ